jgi:hypothetical protein
MILNILNQLASTTKRLEKEAILKANKDNVLLKDVFWAAYNPDLTFWIQQTPPILRNDGSLSLSTAIDKLIVNVAHRAVTGNAAIDFYQSLLCSLSQNDTEVLRRIVARDLRCGVNTPTINKIWKDLIPTYELMLAQTDSKRLVFPCYVQTKFDGCRCLISRTLNDEIVLRTRNGSRITSLDVMVPFLRDVVQPGETLDGELVCYKDGQPLPRKISNGILNKAIRGTITPEEAELVVYCCWDIVDQTQSIPYIYRLENLNCRFATKANDKVFPVKTTMARSMEEVETLFAEALMAGEEGVIAKNWNAVWQPKRTFDQVKFKAEQTADLLVVGWEAGSGKNADRLGALVCETSDGKIRVNVGTGFSDSQRQEFTENKPIDKVVEVRYNSRIAKKDGGLDSLYLPRFIKLRIDKTVANSSEEIK